MHDMDRRCPHRDPFEIEGEFFGPDEVMEILRPHISPERIARLEAVVRGRTYSVAPVMEGLYDRGNVSAVMRSAEAMGYQSIHIIDSSEKFKHANRVTQGADKWLDAREWPSTSACVEQLRAWGYRIVATHFEDAQPIESLDWSIPSAIVFGNEHAGVSAELLEKADLGMYIPMHGFVQSFNISVAAAITLYHVRQARQRQLGSHGDLDEETRRVLLASYYMRSMPTSEKVLLRSRGKQPPERWKPC